MPRSIHGGQHELGQNHLHDRRTLTTLVDLVRSTSGPILEIGAGSGVLTRPLAQLGRPLTAIDIDEHDVHRLRRDLPGVAVIAADATRVTLDRRHRTIVGNVPFHVTTPLLRRLLRARHWHVAVLLVQWEVARKRAGVGGATMMTAQAAPWYAFELHGRVPARAFRPVPSVDGGILRVRRRDEPLVPYADRQAYEALVKAIFTGRGRGVDQILARLPAVSKRARRTWLAETGLPGSVLPRDVRAEDWARLWSAVTGK